MQKYQWIFFDADHTLFQFYDAEKAALAAAFIHFRVPYHEEYETNYHDINMEVWHQFFQGEIPQERIYTLRLERLFAALGMDLPVREFSDLFIEHLALHDRLNENVLETVETLSNDHNLAILTNGLSQLQWLRLEHSEIKPYIRHHFIAEDLRLIKPDSRYFAEVMRVVGFEDKSRVLMVGDSRAADVGGAARFGIHSCWYNPHGRPQPEEFLPTYEIQDMAQLLEITH